MSLYIVDASVAAKWFLREAHRVDAWRLFAPGNRLHAPDFALLELDNLFCKRLRRGELSEEDAREARMLLRQMPLRLAPTASLRDQSFEIAVETRRSPYDCLYLALAVQLGGPMVTADRRFFDAVAPWPLADHVLWVEDVP